MSNSSPNTRRAVSYTRNYKDVSMKLTVILLTSIFALSGCGGQSTMTDRAITSSNGQQSSAPTCIQPGNAVIGSAAFECPLLSNIVAFMGDSITHKWDLTQFDSGPTLNFGVDGDTTAMMLARFDAVVEAAPGVVVILGGITDGPAGTIDSIKAIAAQAQAAGIRVILCSVLPFTVQGQEQEAAHIATLNQGLISLASRSGYLYADYFDVMVNADGTQNQSLFLDGLNPNAAGYAKMWTVIAPLLTEDLN